MDTVRYVLPEDDSVPLRDSYSYLKDVEAAAALPLSSPSGAAVSYAHSSKISQPCVPVVADDGEAVAAVAAVLLPQPANRISASTADLIV